MTVSGEPDLRLEGLGIWVHGREFRDADDHWDGNWLSVTAIMTASGARVETSGPLIRVDEIDAFARALNALDRDLRGKAELACLEPGLRVALEGNGLGQIAATVEITPDQLAQSHRFDFSTDQTFLKRLIAECEAVLAQYPPRGSTSD